MNLELLRKIGLSEGELKVYSALLDIGPASTNKIHERTGIERRNIYDILNKLIEKGLVTYIDENKRRTFQLAPPKKIVNYIEEKEDSLKSIKMRLEGMLPEIMSKFESSKPEIRAEVYRGQEGIKAVWEDMLKKGAKNIYWIGSGNYVPIKFPAFFDSWSKRRADSKIYNNHLFRGDKRGLVPKKPLQNIKFLPPEFNGNPTVTCIFRNKVVQFLFGESLFAFVIESKELSENYISYFKYLWENVAKA